MLDTNRINDYRVKTFCIGSNYRLSTKEEAIQFANQRGFIFFWPIKNITYPSLWTAVAGDRPVANQHDDPGHVSWGWKDSLLGSHHWYYAKVLRKRATIISLKTVPYFYALSENYGSPEEDYLTLYERGRMTQEAKIVYKVLLEQGEMDTIALRRASHMTSKESDSRFNRALIHLQADFKIVPVRITRSGGWRYAFAYDLVSRHYPNLVERARNIQERLARERLTDLYFRSVGAARFQDVKKIFQWSDTDTSRAILDLVKRGSIQQGLIHTDCSGEWIAINELT